jgi:hypothetical protein
MLEELGEVVGVEVGRVGPLVYLEVHGDVFDSGALAGTSPWQRPTEVPAGRVDWLWLASHSPAAIAAGIGQAESLLFAVTVVLAVAAGLAGTGV